MRLSRLTEPGLSWSLAKGAPHIKVCRVDPVASPLTVQVRPCRAPLRFPEALLTSTAREAPLPHS